MRSARAASSAFRSVRARRTSGSNPRMLSPRISRVAWFLVAALLSAVGVGATSCAQGVDESEGQVRKHPPSDAGDAWAQAFSGDADFSQPDDATAGSGGTDSSSGSGGSEPTGGASGMGGDPANV